MGLGLEQDHISASIGELSKWFKEYKIEDLELTISGILESGGIRKLLVSDKGGLKVRQKPIEKEDLVEAEEENHGRQRMKKKSDKKIQLLFPKLHYDEEEKDSA
jgi:hypothetical protein